MRQRLQEWCNANHYKGGWQNIMNRFSFWLDLSLHLGGTSLLLITRVNCSYPSIIQDWHSKIGLQYTHVTMPKWKMVQFKNGLLFWLNFTGTYQFSLNVRFFFNKKSQKEEKKTTKKKYSDISYSWKSYLEFWTTDNQQQRS